jgi:hypothetical protein
MATPAYVHGRVLAQQRLVALFAEAGVRIAGGRNGEG